MTHPQIDEMAEKIIEEFAANETDLADVARLIMKLLNNCEDYLGDKANFLQHDGEKWAADDCRIMMASLKAAAMSLEVVRRVSERTDL